jgi:hypothetical protein
MSARIATGRLLSGSTKKFVMSLKVPVDQIQKFDLSSIQLRYTVAGDDFVVSLPSQSLQLAVIAPARKPEALASIDKDSYINVWTKNNLGVMKQEVNQFIRAGEKAKAKAVIDGYRQEVKSVEASSGVGLYDALADELSEMDSELDEAFTGSAPVQAEKRNRLAKKSHADSRSVQRQSIN